MGRIIRCITSDGCVTAMAIDSTDIVSKAEQIHCTSAVITAAMGRLATAASMMGAALKSKNGSVTLRISGDGPARMISAVSDADGNVKVCPHQPIVEIPLKPNGKLDVGGAIGNGELSVVKDVGMKEPYIGVVPLVSGEIAEDITSYFATSEQIPTVCALGVLVNPDLTVKVAGGYLIQLLPTADDEIITKVEKSIQSVKPITSMMDMGMSLEDIVKSALSEFDVEVLDEGFAEYRCNCSRERTERVLLSLSVEELQSIVDEQQVTEVCCHFCNSEYKFTNDEVRRLIDKKIKKN